MPNEEQCCVLVSGHYLSCPRHPDNDRNNPPGPALMRAYNRMCGMGHVAGLRAVYELGLRASVAPPTEEGK